MFWGAGTARSEGFDTAATPFYPPAVDLAVFEFGVRGRRIPRAPMAPPNLRSLNRRVPMVAHEAVAPDPAGTGEPDTARTLGELGNALTRVRSPGAMIGLVPALGSLHRGHVSLVEHARRQVDVVVLSTPAVSPGSVAAGTAFGPGTAFTSGNSVRPQALDRAGERGVDLVFAPTFEEMYPQGPPVVNVTPGAMGDRLCGAGSPNHFIGELTALARLLGLIRPDRVFFGRLEFQQGAMTRRMVDDLALAVEVEIGPLLREHDGTAVSALNLDLSPVAREVAPRLFANLDRAASEFAGGVTDPGRLSSAVRDRIRRGGGFRVEYVEVVDPRTLESVAEAGAGHVLAAAVVLDRVRLIDNVVLGSDRSDPRLPPPDRSRRA